MTEGQKKKDRNAYPKENWCDYDYMEDWIRKQKYEIKTDMENLIANIFAYYEEEIGTHVSEFDTGFGNFEGTYIEAVQAFVDASGGLSGFDY